MLQDPTARPTLRVLLSLRSGWESPFQQRAVQDGRFGELHPLAALRHPILRKCAAECGDDPSREAGKVIIKAAGDLRLQEIRSSQWRAGVWTDVNGVRWVVAAGLAKGGHDDHDDFYRVLEERCRTPEGRRSFLPTEKDLRILKEETAARIRLRWELDLQQRVEGMLRALSGSESSESTVDHPITGAPFAAIRITRAETADTEEYVVELKDLSLHGSALVAVLERRVLLSISRPVQDWDIAYGIYAAMEEPGHLDRQLHVLGAAVHSDELLAPDLGNQAHRVHRRHIGDAAINGKAVRAACGVFFVPTQDPDSLDECVECRRILEKA